MPFQGDSNLNNMKAKYNDLRQGRVRSNWFYILTWLSSPRLNNIKKKRNAQS